MLFTKTKTDEERFWSKVKKSILCWEWQATTMGSGHGAFYFRGKMWYAHRVSWVLEHGEIESGLCVLHRCDNAICVNPSHLFLGTYKDNIADMDRKGRRALNERNGRCKLTAKNVEYIREFYKTGAFSRRDISNIFGVNESTVTNIINRKRRLKTYERKYL